MNTKVNNSVTLRDRIREAIEKSEGDADLAAKAIIMILEWQGLSLDGNGWIEDDEDAMDFLDADDTPDWLVELRDRR